MTEGYDLIIIGGGPAGLSAAIYGGRARLRTLVLEKGAIGGRAQTTREIVNYPGYTTTTGPKLTDDMRDHAEQFGAMIRTEKVNSLELEGTVKTVRTRRHTYEAPAVIIATGTESRVLGIPGERELTGQGVAYCATCDAEFFQDQHVVVVGSGDQGIEESMYIAKYASKVTIVVLHEEGILDCNKQAAEKAFAHPKLHFIWNSVVDRVNGEEEVTSVTVKNLKTGQLTELSCGGIFFFVGLIPSTAFLGDALPKTKTGYLITNDMMETSVEGVYAVGDVRDKYLRQVSTAVGDGAIAATAAERYIEELRDFEERVVKNPKPVLLALWNPEYQEGLSRISGLATENETAGSPCSYYEIDVSRKKALARQYHITLSQDHPAEVLLLEQGRKVKTIRPGILLTDQIKEEEE